MLTARQREVLQHVAQGKRNKEIAYAMNIGERTVHRHLDNAYHRLGCRSRIEAIVLAGIVTVGA